MRGLGLISISLFFLSITCGMCVGAEDQLISPVPFLIHRAISISDADAVYKVKRISIADQGTFREEYNNGTKIEYYPIKAVTMRVLSTIKGDPVDTVTATFVDHPGNSGDAYMNGAPAYIVFLGKSSDSPPHYGYGNSNVIKAVPDSVAYSFGDKSEDKLLAELIAVWKAYPGTTREQAAWTIAEMTNSKALPFLREISKSKDVVDLGESLQARIACDDSRCVDGILDYMKLDPDNFDKDQNDHHYGSTSASVNQIQLGLVYHIGTSLSMDRPCVQSLESKSPNSMRVEAKGEVPRPWQKVKGFDYSRFLTNVLKTTAGHNSYIQAGIGQIFYIKADPYYTPEMISLLDSSSISARYYVVRGLMKLDSWDSQQQPDSFEEYKKNESLYIDYFKRWWKEHSGKFRRGKPCS